MAKGVEKFESSIIIIPPSLEFSLCLQFSCLIVNKWMIHTRLEIKLLQRAWKMHQIPVS